MWTVEFILVLILLQRTSGREKVIIYTIYVDYNDVHSHIHTYMQFSGLECVCVCVCALYKAEARWPGSYGIFTGSILLERERETFSVERQRSYDALRLCAIACVKS